MLCVIPFTLDFSRLSPETFVHDVLVEHLHASAVVVGENFRFGHKAAGDVALLERLGPDLRVHRRGRAAGGERAGRAWSRRRTSGPVWTPATWPRRPGRWAGRTGWRGRRPRRRSAGASSGYPTANLLTAPHAAVPADGVYAGWLTRRAGAPLTAAVSIGTNPTFAGRERRVEAYVLDFDADLYGERLALDFVARLREQRRYDGHRAAGGPDRARTSRTTRSAPRPGPDRHGC